MLNYTNPDSLAEHIRCLYSISYELEKNIATNVIKAKDLQQMQQYMLSFWINRDALHSTDFGKSIF